MTSLQKMIAAALLFALWAGLAVAAPPTPAVLSLIDGVRLALVALGVFTTSMSNPKE